MSKQTQVLYIIAAVAGLIICSRISFVIPLSEEGIPITGQTLAVSLIIYYLRPVNSIISIIIYLLLGAIGLPVFADGGGGMDVLFGKTGGYLYGFLIANLVVNILPVDWESTILRRFLLFTLITIVVLLVGMVHLGVFIGIEKAFLYGVLPFLLGGIVKIILAVLMSIGLDKMFIKLSTN